jgi:membrane-bound lytic murein transglycosylase B
MPGSTMPSEIDKLGGESTARGKDMNRGANWCARAVLAISVLLASGCVTTEGEAQEQVAAASDGTVPLPVKRPARAPESQPVGEQDGAGGDVTMPGGDFETWKGDFRKRALAAGITAEVFDAGFAGVVVNEHVLELDRYQPEFVRPIWEYLDSAVSETRIADGRARASERNKTLRGIEARYGVDLGIVAAIWGIESAYGVNYGSIAVVESLATLAFDGRRREFAEEQLIAALRIQQSGDVSPARMVGSWAGAMGHTQFIPTSYEAYAVDFTGDGRRDVWADNPADALASTANYLGRFGWQRAEPSVIEVKLPEGFDYRLADDHTGKSAAEWEALGVRRTGKGRLLPADALTILLPAGARGPAFAVYPNFRVIKRYNNATSYALAVALLAGQIDDSINFGARLTMNWPRGDRPLTREETEELQRRLTALGYPTDGIDGIVGPNTRSAIRGFQADKGMIPDGYLSAALLARVRVVQGG